MTIKTKVSEKFCLKVAENLFVEGAKIVSENVEATEQQSLSLSLLDDNSWSMSGHMSKLRDVSKKLVSSDLREGDAVSVISYGSRNDAQSIVTPIEIKSLDDKAGIYRMIDGMKVHGCTCFRTPLKLWREEHLSTIKNFHQKDLTMVVFMTDGYPNDCSWDEIAEQLRLLGDDVYMLYIGFGSNYGKEMLSKMQAITGGLVVHASDMDDYYTVIEESVGAAEKIFEYEMKDLIHKNEDEVLAITLDLDSKMHYVQKADATQVTSLVPEFMYARLVTKKSMAVTKFGDLTPDQLDAVYSVALACSTSMKSREALRILSHGVKDTNLAELFMKATTVDEFGYAEGALQEAIKSNEMKYLKGKKALANSKYPTIFDVVEVLILNNAEVRPLANDYKYTSLKSIKSLTDDVKAVATYDDKWRTLNADSIILGNKSEKTLNMSLRFNSQGTIDLTPEDSKSVNRLVLDVTKSKNYSLAEFSPSGLKPLQKIKIKMTEDLRNDLKAINAINANQKADEMDLNLAKFPLAKIDLDQDALSSDTIADYIITRKGMEIYQALLKLRQEELIAEGKGPKSTGKNTESLSPEAKELLWNNYRYRAGFQQLETCYHEDLGNKKPTKAQLEDSLTESSPYYTAEIDLKIGNSKFNSVPALGGKSGKKWWKTFNKAQESGKMTTMHKVVEGFKAEIATMDYDEVVKTLKESKLGITKYSLMISEMLYTHALGKVEFEGQESRDFVHTGDSELGDAEYTLNIKFGTKEVFYGQYMTK